MNRLTNQFRGQFEKRVTSVFMHVTFGASGAPTLDTTNSKGVVSITRNSTGLYTIVFGTQASMLDAYVKLLGVSKMFTVADREMILVANNISTNTLASLQIQFNLEATATDPTSGSQVYMEFVFGDSTAP